MLRIARISALLVLLAFTCSCPCVSAAAGAARWIAEQVDKVARIAVETGAEAVWEDYRACLLDPAHPNAQVQLLQKYAPEEAGPVPDDFYTYFGFRDWWRFPLVYPYSIIAVDTTEQGRLARGDGADFRDPNTGSRVSGLDGITRLAFDQNLLLVETGAGYRLFAFDTQEVRSYATEEDLWAAAKEQGYQGEPQLITLDAYGSLFTCEE